MTPDGEQLIDALDARVRRRGNRRAFFTAALGAAAVGATAFAYSDPALAQAAGPTDADILNFALNLEYLEANFYSFAVNGAAIPAASTDGSGNLGQATGGRAVPFDPVIGAYAREIAADELAHVNFLRNTLAAGRVAQPRIDVSNTPFRAAAAAAGIPNAANFDAYADENSFLLAAYLFEDVGVTAYKGAAPLLTNNTFLDASAGILAAEAFHAGIIRGALYRRGLELPVLRTAADSISNARDTVDGAPTQAGPPQLVADADQGISPVTTPFGTASNFVPTDNNGIVFSRSTGQVLNIVYLNRASVTLGGFFPAGVNGNIRTSAAS